MKRVVKPHKIFQVWNPYLICWWDLLEKHFLGLVCGLISQSLTLSKFCLEIGSVVIWNLAHELLTLLEKLVSSDCSTSSDTHIFSLVLRNLETTDC